MTGRVLEKTAMARSCRDIALWTVFALGCVLALAYALAGPAVH